MNTNNKINNPNTALELLKQYILISKSYGVAPCFYVKTTNDNIMVINQNLKYYMTKDEFIANFYLSSFYVYKDLNEVEIDQEFHNLRQ